MGYVLVFGPILLPKPYRFLLPFLGTFGLTILMILNIRLWQVFPLGRAILMACYGFAPVILSAAICTLSWDSFLKASVCVAISTVMFYFTNYIATALFGPGGNSYRVDFTNWQECTNGNVYFIFLVSFLLLSAVFTIIGLRRIQKHRKTDL